MIEVAIQNKIPVRLGVNWGSLAQQLLTTLLEKNAMCKKPAEGPINSNNFFY